MCFLLFTACYSFETLTPLAVLTTIEQNLVAFVQRFTIIWRGHTV